MDFSQSRLYVFTNHRAIRDFISKNYAASSLLDKLLTIDEFEKRAQLFPERRFIDDDQRNTLLKEAADFSGFELLKIEKDFLKFIKSSSTILKFFEELSKESVTFEMIERADTYAEYDNHLNVLKTLHARYMALLDEHMYIDPINAPFIYRVNDAYLKRFSEIHIFFEGYLSRYEIELFEGISKATETFLHISTSSFTKKMHDRFDGFRLEAGREYSLDISKKEIAKERKIEKKYDIKIYAAPTRLFQAAAVKKAIFDLLQNENLDPQKSAVILPDEEFAEVLGLYDNGKNFNYAMGASFYNETLYKKLKALYDLREDETYENILRAKRFEVEKEIYKKEWERVIDFDEVTAIFETYAKEIEDIQKRHTYLANIHALKKIKKELKGYPFKEIFHLFLNRLASASTDIAGGGNITVMGALESRGVEFDAVIVCDFNEGFVPKENKKDLYLNSAVRRHSGLPTRGDRQNLQLDLYHNLFLRSKRAAVIYTQNEESIPSTFLKQLGIEKEPVRIGYEHSLLLYKKSKESAKKEDIIELDVDLAKEPLSATKLKDYIACKRKFYYKYIERIKEYIIPSDEHEAYAMGNLLHQSMYNVFTKKSGYLDEKELFKDIERELKKLIKDDIALQFEGDIWLKKLEAFAKRETERFAGGYEVFLCEERMERDFNGIRLEGVIDRIDKRDGRLTVIDYKSGAFPATTKNTLEKTKDFQLVFYHMLASVHGEVDEVFYYDLNSAEIVRDDFLQEKKRLLVGWIERYKEKRQSFDMTDDIKECRYCPYAIICGRE